MAETADQQRYSQMKLQLVCQKCGCEGLIPWQQLDRILVCHGCSTWYRLDSRRLVEVEPPAVRNSKIQVEVRSNSSQWREHQVVLTTTRPWRPLSFAVLIEWLSATGLAARCIAGAGLLLLALLALMVTNREPAAATIFVMPGGLEERSAVFVQAWLAGDLDRMLQLTEPARDRDLRRWLKKSAAPQQEQTTAIAPSVAKVQVSSIKRPDRKSAEVNLRVANAGPGAELLLKHQWVEKQGVWYFQPTPLPQPSVRKF